MMSRSLKTVATISICLILFYLSFPSSLPASFAPFEIKGYTNHGQPGDVTCDSLAKPALLRVEPSIHLQDDLQDIARSLDGHPMVKYPDGLTVDNAWLRLAGASVWLPRHHVFMAITRIIFFDDGRTDWPVISFLRAQLYDETWTQVNKTLGGISFPCILDIPAEYEEGGRVFGPEDARILEVDSSPIIVFNMISRPDWKRAMYVYLPFTNRTTRLHLRGREALKIEKNWAPFVHGRGNHINFVYTFSPLQVLWCSLTTGECDMAYDQATLAPGMLTPHQVEGNALKGGTNFVQHGESWVALPKTHIGTSCGPVYRPMFLVMSHSGVAYYTTWASGPVDFGHAVLTPEQRRDCHQGRILIPNSISRWDKRRDIMTISVSVGDKTNQVLRVHGVLGLLTQSQRVDRSVASERFLQNADLSAVGNDVAQCGIQASLNESRRVQ